MSTMVPDTFMESKLVCYLPPFGIFSYQHIDVYRFFPL